MMNQKNPKSAKEHVICSWCGKVLDDEESVNPRTDSNNDVMCDDCYSDEYQYRCWLCDEWVDTEDNEKHLIVLKELAEDQDMKPGIYEVVGYPVYSDSILGDSFVLHQSSITFKKPLPKNIDEYDEIISGFICEDCYKAQPEQKKEVM